MSKSNFPIVLPLRNEVVTTTKKVVTMAKEAPQSTSNFEYLDSRDDYDVQVEEERNRLFTRTSSLSFPIEHYCMMVEKVNIMFLSFKFLLLK